MVSLASSLLILVLASLSPMDCCHHSLALFGSITLFTITFAAALCLLVVLFLLLHFVYHGCEFHFSTYVDQFILLSIVPPLRLAKMLRCIHSFHLLHHVATLLSKALPSMLDALIITGWFLTSLLLLFEPKDNNLPPPHSKWLMGATMPTVG